MSLIFSISFVNFVTTGRDRPALKDLIIHVIPLVAIRWFDIGAVLLDAKYHNELAIIERDEKNDAATCCRKMFTKWLDTKELASWATLIQALKQLKLNKVASDVEQLLQGEYIYVILYHYVVIISFVVI